MVETEKLGKYLTEDLKLKFDLPSRLSLFFMATGEKPGARIMFVDESKKQIIEDFCEDLGLNYRNMSTDFHEKYFISLSETTFQVLEKIDENEPYHTKTSQGEFLGYPEKAVRYFIRNRESEMKTSFNRKIDEMLENDEIDEGKLFLLDLVLYTPQPTRDGVKNALGNGEKRRELMRQHDIKNNSELGQKLAEEVFNQSEPSFRDFR